MLQQEYGRPELQHGFGVNPLDKVNHLGGFLGSSPSKNRKAGETLGIDLREGIRGLGIEPRFRLDPRDLIIPEPGPGFKTNPQYNPSALPLMIDKEILNPGFMGAGGFGVS